jgi:AraC family transcriptional regulator of arabinose operon
MRGLVTFPGELHAGETVTGDPDHVWRPQGMDAWVLNLTVAGHGLIRQRQGLFRCDPGRLALWPPGVAHAYGAGPAGWTHLWVYFHPRPAWLELLAWPEAGDGVLTLDLAGHEHGGRVEALLRAISAVMAGGQPRRVAIAQAQLEQLLLWCDAANPHAATGLDPRLGAAIGFALARLERPLVVAELARAAGCSPSRFAHLFTAQLGLPPLAWLERSRIERAREQLLISGRAIAEIGRGCGYGDPTWFARVFRRHTGLTPRAYRQAGGHLPQQTRQR